MLTLYLYLSSMKHCVEYWTSHNCIPYFVTHGERAISNDLSHTDYAQHLNTTGPCYQIRKISSDTLTNARDVYFWYATDSNGLALYKSALETLGPIVNLAADRITDVCSTITSSLNKQVCYDEALSVNLALQACEKPPVFSSPNSSAGVNISWVNLAVPLLVTAYLCYTSNQWPVEQANYEINDSNRHVKPEALKASVA